VKSRLSEVAQQGEKKWDCPAADQTTGWRALDGRSYAAAPMQPLLCSQAWFNIGVSSGFPGFLLSITLDVTPRVDCGVLARCEMIISQAAEEPTFSGERTRIWPRGTDCRANVVDRIKCLCEIRTVDSSP
jgi:hypothetical protein